jgi:hypothetical protein
MKMDGSPLSAEELAEFLSDANEHLGEELKLIQHGPHDYWEVGEDYSKAGKNVGPQISKGFTAYIPKDGPSGNVAVVEIIEVNEANSSFESFIKKLPEKSFEDFYPLLHAYYVEKGTMPDVKNLSEF